MTTNIGVMGSSGRVGGHLLELIEADADLALSLSITSQTNFNDIEEKLSQTDCLIDFTNHLACAQWLNLLIEKGKPLPIITGSTGWTTESESAIKRYAEHAPILIDSNMGLGTNIFFALTTQVAQMLKNHPQFQAKIQEIHHCHKVDAPSGTALKLKDLIRQQIDQALDSETDVVSLRGGDVVGEHTVFFFGEGERIELTHKATNRDIFAKGALLAAQWLKGKGPGLYSMKDVLL